MKSFADQPTTRLRKFGLGLVLALTSTLGSLACDNENAKRDEAAAALANAPIPLASDARLRVQVDAVRMDSLAATERITGTVRALHRADITAEAQGRVLRRVLEPGAAVEAGGIIVELEASRFELELRRAEASLAAARTVFAHAERELARGDRLIKQKAISTQQHDDLKHAVNRARDEISLARVARDTAKRNLADTQITAPFAGAVDRIAVDVGDFVAPGTPVATLVDFSKARIFGGVTAREASRLTPGTVARVSFTDMGGAVFEATLQSVSRVASPADGTYEIELRMDNAEGRLRDGLVAVVELPDAEATPQLLARRAALLRRDGHAEVFVIEGGGEGNVARTRRVRTGRKKGEWVEILDGLSAGDRVVWDGHFALGDGSRVVIDGEG